MVWSQSRIAGFDSEYCRRVNGRLGKTSPLPETDRGEAEIPKLGAEFVVWWGVLVSHLPSENASDSDVETNLNHQVRVAFHLLESTFMFFLGNMFVCFNPGVKQMGIS